MSTSIWIARNKSIIFFSFIMSTLNSLWEFQVFGLVRNKYLMDNQILRFTDSRNLELFLCFFLRFLAANKCCFVFIEKIKILNNNCAALTTRTKGSSVKIGSLFVFMCAHRKNNDNDEMVDAISNFFLNSNN